MLKSWQAITLWKRVLIGLAIEMLVGVALFYGWPRPALADGATAEQMAQHKAMWNGPQIAEDFFQPFGEAFVNLIKMLVVPLIATTLVAGVTAMGDPKKLGSLGARTMGLYLLTTFFAVSLGLAMGTIVKPGAGVNYKTGDAGALDAVKGKIETAESASGSIADKLLDIIPTNPLQALATGNVLQIIFFSVLIGIGILVCGKIADPVRVFFDAAAEVVMKITMLIMELAPFGVMALMVWVIGTRGFGVVANMGKLRLHCMPVAFCKSYLFMPV